MQGSLYVALSSQIALERRLTTLADNVANANTSGFRATEVKFNEILANTGASDVSFVGEGKDFLKTSNGGLKATGSQLDFALRGDAWFMIETPTGQMLTRDGRFTITDTGQLVNINGYPVLDPGEAPIEFTMKELGILCPLIVADNRSALLQVPDPDADPTKKPAGAMTRSDGKSGGAGDLPPGAQFISRDVYEFTLQFMWIPVRASERLEARKAQQAAQAAGTDEVAGG